jgi:hypothetical protein
MESVMNLKLVAVLLAMSSTAALAQATSNQNDIDTKVQSDLPGTKGGTTSDPTAKPASPNDISAKAQSDLPGTKGGSTTNPNAGKDPADGKPTSDTAASNALKTKPGSTQN